MQFHITEGEGGMSLIYVIQSIHLEDKDNITIKDL